MNATEEYTGNAVLPNAPVLIEIPEGLEALARRYIVSRQKELPVFQELLGRSDFDTIRKMSHNLKGTGTSYGFADISRLGAAIERASKEQDLPEASSQLIALSAYVLAAAQQLQ